MARGEFHLLHSIGIKVGSTNIGIKAQFMSFKDIPDICPIFYTTKIKGLEILHLKLRKFATKVASQQNSVN